MIEIGRSTTAAAEIALWCIKRCGSIRRRDGERRVAAAVIGQVLARAAGLRSGAWGRPVVAAVGRRPCGGTIGLPGLQVLGRRRLERERTGAHEIATWCIENSGSVLKTAIECAVPMRPFIDGVIARGYRTLLNGMSGGMLWGVGRQAMMQLANVSKEKGDAAGLKHWQDLKVRWLEYERTGFPPNATRVCSWYTARRKGGLWYDPLAELVDLMAGATYAELNRPRAKSLAVKAFPTLAETPVLHGGLQVVAGVREYMDLVMAKEHGCEGAAQYYRHIAHQLNIKSRGSDEAKALWKTR